jgi:sec-independent protein translocase protein TatC
MASKDLQTTPAGGAPDPTEQSFVSHLVELRSRLLRALACVFVVMLCLMPVSNQLYAWLAQPLLAKMAGEATMIATEVGSPFFAPFKLAVFVAIFISVPYILYQAWAFVAPGLYLKERRLALPLLLTSTLLFYIGIAFCYFVVFPLVFGFFTTTAPDNVTIMTDISHYLDFVLKMFLAFGVAFEVPVATFLVVRSGITTAESLTQKRPYIIVGAFAVGALLTPPDVLSQCLLSIPMWLLYEVGLVFSRHFGAPGDEAVESDGASTAENP